MKDRYHLGTAGLLAALLALALVLGGCVIRRTRPVAPQPVVVTQPAPRPGVVTQPAPRPVVVTPPVRPVVVTRPAPVYVTTPAPSPQMSNGVVAFPHQRVRYPLSVSYARTVNIYVDGHGLDPTVAVYNSYGGRVGFNDDGGSGLDSQLSLTLAPGSYVVEVAGYSSSTGPFTMTIQ